MDVRVIIVRAISILKYTGYYMERCHLLGMGAHLG